VLDSNIWPFFTNRCCKLVNNHLYCPVLRELSLWRARVSDRILARRRRVFFRRSTRIGSSTRAALWTITRVTTTRWRRILWIRRAAFAAATGVIISGAPNAQDNASILPTAATRHPAQHAPKMPPDHVTLRQQQPLILGMLERASADLTNRCCKPTKRTVRGSF
jgi:hypothetical protein